MKVENRIMKNKTRNIIWTVAGVLFLIGLVCASTITDTYTTNGNITNNNTGIYYNNQKTFARTADVVVCSSTTALNNFYKKFTCDVVCEYTDTPTQCGTKINTSISDLSTAGGGLIYISSGIYPNSVYINPRSNIKIVGSGSSTVLDLVGIDEYFRFPGGTLNNFEISDVKFNQTFVGNGVGIGIDNTTANNLYIHDIDFGNINFAPFRVFGTGLNQLHKNIKIERVVTNYSRIVLGSIDGLILRDNTFNQTGNALNPLADISYSENNNLINNALIEGNRFINTIGTASCLAMSSNSTDFKIVNNYFNCNGSSIIYALNDATYRVTADISHNYFEGRSDASSNGIVFVDINIRSPDSFTSIEDNKFIDLNNKYYGITTELQTTIKNNYFYKNGFNAVYCGDICDISENRFIDASGANQAWKWIDLAGDSNYSKLTDNRFIASSANANTIIKITGYNLTVKGNTYTNLSSTLYVQNAGSINSTYIDDYVYSGLLTDVICGANPTYATNGKTIYNSTNGCRCTSGSWKCWTMS